MRWPHHRARLVLTVLATIALAGASLAITTEPASANRWRDDVYLVKSTDGMTAPRGCSTEDLDEPLPRAKHLLPGAAASTISGSHGARSTDIGNLDDTITVMASITAKARLLGSTSTPTGLTFNYHGSGSSTTSSGMASICDPYTAAAVTIDTLLHITSRTRLTVYADAYGAGMSQLTIGPTSLIVGNTPATQHATAILKPGWYPVHVHGDIAIGGPHPGSVTGSGMMTVSFSPTGSRTRMRGTTRYVTMPKTRNCIARSVRPKVTKVAARARKIKKIAFRINGHRVKTVRHPRRGTKIRLTAHGGRSLALKARVKLTNGRTVTSRASYQPCS